MQCAPKGNPEQEVEVKLTVLLYPGWPVMVRARLPLPPGDGIVMLGPPGENVKSAFTETVIGAAEDAK